VGLSRGTILRAAVAAILLSLFASAILGACDPSAEGRPMPVLVQGTANGWTAIVPICNRDTIGRFDLNSPHGSLESRWNRSAEGRSARNIHLLVNPATLASGAFNPSEAVVVSRDGQITDPSGIDDVHVTSRGFADWSMTDINFDRSTTWLVTGRTKPTPVAPGASTPVIAAWCRP